MGTVTSQFLIGHNHRNHGGINPTHYIFLSENRRPALTLVPENIFDIRLCYDKITWIPTIENMIEDAILMIAINVLKDKRVIDLSKEYFRSKNRKWIELYKDIDEDKLYELYELCRGIDTSYKIVITAMEGSHILKQLHVLDKYKMDLEVCTPVYSRYYSEWNKKTEVRGELEYKKIER